MSVFGHFCLSRSGDFLLALTLNHETISPDVLKDFLDFVKMPEKARDSFLADFDFLEFSTNNRQTILLIKNKEYGIIIENNLDCEKNDKELKQCFDKCLTECYIKPPMIVSINWRTPDERKIPQGIKEFVHNITAKELADFFNNLCEKQSEESLTKGILSQYSKKLANKKNASPAAKSKTGVHRHPELVSGFT